MGSMDIIPSIRGVGIGLILLIYTLCKLRSVRKISIQIKDTAIVALIMVIGYMLYHSSGEIIKHGLAGTMPGPSSYRG